MYSQTITFLGHSKQETPKYDPHGSPHGSSLSCSPHLRQQPSHSNKRHPRSVLNSKLYFHWCFTVTWFHSRPIQKIPHHKCHQEISHSSGQDLWLWGPPCWHLCLLVQKWDMPSHKNKIAWRQHLLSGWTLATLDQLQQQKLIVTSVYSVDICKMSEYVDTLHFFLQTL